MPKGTGRPKYIACDATYDIPTGYAGIACCEPGGRPLNAKVVQARGNNEAEGQAILLAMSECLRRRIRFAEFRCDNTNVIRAIENGGPHRESEELRQVVAAILELRREAHSFGEWWRWEFAHVARSDVTPAHRLANIAFKNWKRGRAHALEHGDLEIMGA